MEGRGGGAGLRYRVSSKGRRAIPSCKRHEMQSCVGGRVTIILLVCNSHEN